MCHSIMMTLKMQHGYKSTKQHSRVWKNYLSLVHAGEAVWSWSIGPLINYRTLCRHRKPERKPLGMGLLAFLIITHKDFFTGAATYLSVSSSFTWKGEEVCNEGRHNTLPSSRLASGLTGWRGLWSSDNSHKKIALTHTVIFSMISFFCVYFVLYLLVITPAVSQLQQLFPPITHQSSFRGSQSRLIVFFTEQYTVYKKKGNTLNFTDRGSDFAVEVVQSASCRQ